MRFFVALIMEYVVTYDVITPVFTPLLSFPHVHFQFSMFFFEPHQVFFVHIHYQTVGFRLSKKHLRTILNHRISAKYASLVQGFNMKICFTIDSHEQFHFALNYESYLVEDVTRFENHLALFIVLVLERVEEIIKEGIGKGPEVENFTEESDEVLLPGVVISVELYFHAQNYTWELLL